MAVRVECEKYDGYLHRPFHLPKTRYKIQNDPIKPQKKPKQYDVHGRSFPLEPTDVQQAEGPKKKRPRQRHKRHIIHWEKTAGKENSPRILLAKVLK